MLKHYYNVLKHYTLKDALVLEKNVFERVKIELMFNLVLIFSVVYLLGFIKLIINGYWYILAGRLFGLIIVVSFYYAFKRTKHYRVTAFLWVVGILILGLQGLIINNGVLTYANLGFSMLNLSIAVLMLDRLSKVIFFGYYFVFLIVSLMITYSLIPMIEIGIDFNYNRQFFLGNSVFALVPFALLIYVLYAFLNYEYRVKVNLSNRIDYTVQQEEKIRNANKAMHKSIQLAAKIQKALIPDLTGFESYYQDNFILLKPKNELYGDYYWVSEENDCLYIALIDSTENDISGAIISSIYFDILKTAINKKKISRTNDIICHINKEIKKKVNIENYKKETNVSMIKIDKISNKLYFSSEKNPLYLIKKNRRNMASYRPKFESMDEDCILYREDVIDFQSDDMIYLSSDGLANQFGGFQNIKFKESVLKAFLQEIKAEPLDIQKQLILDKLKIWRKDRLQSDDVCLIGLKL